MGYINVGAYVDGNRPKSKKALRDALKNAPNTVTFDPTSMFDKGGTRTIDNLYPDDKFQVTGPDPYKDRKWYATISKNGDKVTVA